MAASDGRETGEHIFHSYTDKAGDISFRRRWIVIVICAFVCVAGCVAGRMIWNGYVLAKYGPYRDMVGRLHPGMSETEMFDALGNPYNPLNPSDKDSEMRKRSLDVSGQHDEFLYMARGTSLPLSIKFDEMLDCASGREDHGDCYLITNWCYDGECHKVD